MDGNRQTPLQLPPTIFLLLCPFPDGAQASTTVYSVMEMAKANGLNPEKYISHLLTVLSECFAQDPKAAVNDLLPWDEAVQHLYQRSHCRIKVTVSLPLLSVRVFWERLYV